MPSRDHLGALAAVAAIAAVIAASTLATWPAPGLNALATRSSARACVPAEPSITTSDGASIHSSIPLSKDVSIDDSRAKTADVATFALPRSPASSRSRIGTAPASTADADADARVADAGASRHPVGASAGSTLAAGDQLLDDAASESARPGAPASSSAQEHRQIEFRQGVYRNRVAGSWINVPPPDRHYQGSASDPLAPSGAG